MPADAGSPDGFCSGCGYDLAGHRHMPKGECPECGATFRATWRVRSGFTLVELLIAIGIFAIGMIAVASIFPTAILLQKQTVTEVKATQFGSNAKAMIGARGFPESSLTGLPDGVVSPSRDAIDSWSQSDRMYLARYTVEVDGQDELTTAMSGGSDVFWVPLFFDTNPDPDERAWQLFVFIVTSHSDTIYSKAGDADDCANPDDFDQYKPAEGKIQVPGIKRAAVTTDGADAILTDNEDWGRIFVGDEVVDNAGRTYKVESVDDDRVTLGFDFDVMSPALRPTHIWYAHPGDKDRRTFARLIVLVDGDDGNVVR